MSALIIPHSGTYFDHLEFAVVKNVKKNTELNVTVFEKRHKHPVYVAKNNWPSGNKLTLPPGNYHVRAELFMPRLDGSILKLHTTEAHYIVIRKDTDPFATSAPPAARVMREELSSNGARAQRLGSFPSAYSMSLGGDEAVSRNGEGGVSLRPVPSSSSVSARERAPRSVPAHPAAGREGSHASIAEASVGGNGAMSAAEAPRIWGLAPREEGGHSQAGREDGRGFSPGSQPLVISSPEASRRATPTPAISRKSSKQYCGPTQTEPLYDYSVQSSYAPPSLPNKPGDSFQMLHGARSISRAQSEPIDGIGIRPRSAASSVARTVNGTHFYKPVDSRRPQVHSGAPFNNVFDQVPAEANSQNNALNKMKNGSGHERFPSEVSGNLGVKLPEPVVYAANSNEGNAECGDFLSLSKRDALSVESVPEKPIDLLPPRKSQEGTLIRSFSSGNPDSALGNKPFFVVAPPNEIDIDQPFSFVLAFGTAGALPQSKSVFLNVMLEEESGSETGIVPLEPIIIPISATWGAIPSVARGLSSPWVCSSLVYFEERQGTIEMRSSPYNEVRSSMAISNVCVGQATNGLALSGIQFLFEGSMEMKSYQFFLSFSEISMADDDETVEGSTGGGDSPLVESMRFSSAVDDNALGAEVLPNSLPYIRFATDENGEMILEVHYKSVIAASERILPGARVAMYFGAPAPKAYGDHQQPYISVLVNYRTVFCKVLKSSAIPDMLRVILMSNVECTVERTAAYLREVEFLSHQRRLVAFADQVTFNEEKLNRLQSLKGVRYANITTWEAGQHPGKSARCGVTLL